MIRSVAKFSFVRRVAIPSRYDPICLGQSLQDTIQSKPNVRPPYVLCLLGPESRTDLSRNLSPVLDGSITSIKAARPYA
jgi:hypothetical protein